MRRMETPKWAEDVLESFLLATDPAVDGGEFGRPLPFHPRTGIPMRKDIPEWRSHLTVATVRRIRGEDGALGESGRLLDVAWGARAADEDPGVFVPVVLMRPDADQSATLKRATAGLLLPVALGEWSFETPRDPSLTASLEGAWLHDGHRFRQKARAGRISPPLFSAGLEGDGRLLLGEILAESAGFLADGFEIRLYAAEADLARMSAHERLEAVLEIEAARSKFPARVREGMDRNFSASILKTFGSAAAAVRMERSEGALRAILSVRSRDGSHVDVDMLGRVPTP